MDNQTEIERGINIRPWRIDWQFQRLPLDRSKFKEVSLPVGTLELEKLMPGSILEIQGDHDHSAYVIFVNPDKTANLAIGSAQTEILPGTTYNAELKNLFSITKDIKEGEKGKVEMGRGFMFPYFDYDRNGRLLPLNQRTVNNSVWFDGLVKVKVLKPLAGEK